MIPSSCQCVVIGGGFYGSCLAIYLRQAGFRVLILERENDLLTRASYANQARVHYGYHYPRSVATGVSCTVNFPRFVIDFRSAVVDRFTKIYAIAKLNSRVTANQFFGFCNRIGAPIRRASSHACLFDSNLIEEVFEVREFAFNASQLRSILKSRLDVSGVQVFTNASVNRVLRLGSSLCVELTNGHRLHCESVYNCTYAGVNDVLQRSELPTLPIKYEIAELALMHPPSELAEMGVTVMDGPFFSTMPFPAESLHSMSHVRYTPHLSWKHSDPEVADRDRQGRNQLTSNFALMIKDASRYLPCLRRSRYSHSLFETKTVLLENEGNDGRPILLRRDYGLPGLHVVMGGKIDNIYDVFSALDSPDNQPNPNAEAHQNRLDGPSTLGAPLSGVTPTQSPEREYQ